ncbi:MAG: ribosome-associated translation inhibitor RaiA [Thermodesulfobacteriota bacterium]
MLKISLTARHTNNKKDTENIRKYINNKTRRLERYLKDRKEPNKINFILSNEKYRNKVELSLNSGPIKLMTSVEMEDINSAVDSALDIIIKQLKKHKDKKFKSKRRLLKNSNLSDRKSDHIQSDSVLSNLSKEKIDTKPMSTEEAILQLNVSEKPFVVYVDINSGETNVVYKDSKKNKTVLITPS